MSSSDRRPAERSRTPSAEGERSAVVGLNGQYQLAARIVVAKLASLDWIRIADPSAGVADDFQFKAGPTRYAIQVKWAQYPASFTWSEFANPSGREPSLLAKLAKAWQRIRMSSDDPLIVHLRSNESPSTNAPRGASPLAGCTATGPTHFAAFLARSFMPVSGHLRGGAKRWSEVAALDLVTEWQPAWDHLKVQSGLDDDAFGSFVGDLAVSFGPAIDDPLLLPDDASHEADVEHLAATLQALVADPARPLQLSRTELLDRLGWADRRRFRHPHKFPVPSIYTANEAARHDLQDRLRTLNGGYVGLVGPAGSGKSTLLASLTLGARRLVRYYAFVPDAPDPLSGRGEADSFLHDVTLALDEAGLPRPGHGNDLRSQRAVLADQLDQAGKRWSDRGEGTVIVVDGLDHIPREQNPTRSLLEELPAPAALPEGVFVILGTQTTAILPSPIRDALAAERRTVDLPPLSTIEVLKLADASGPGDWLLPGQRNQLVIASEGHPLALTYLLEELAALETSEPDIESRRAVADHLLEDASACGGEVHARYRGYLRAADDDPELVDLLAAVSRLRAPVDLEWLKTWVQPRAMDAFVRHTSTFFRRDGSTWRFIHNSFRRFLVEETACVAGTFDEDRDRSFHIKLADVCANSPSQWPIYRDEELAQRFLAGEYDRVISLATPSMLRAKLLDARPPATVRDHALLALRSAATTDDHSTYLRMLLFLNELWQREYVLEPAKLATTMVELGPPERALEHLMAGGLLRVPAASALNAAARLARAGRGDAAAEILRSTGSLTDLVQDRSRAHDRDVADAVADWAEVTFHLSGVDAVLAQLDDQLPLPTVPVSSEEHIEGADPADDGTDWEAERREREKAERDATVTASRNQAMARCFDLLSEVRDDAQLAALLDRIDDEASSGWRARARVVHALDAYRDGDRDAVLRWAREVIKIDSAGLDPDEDPDGEGAGPGEAGGVPLSLRLDTADVLIRAGLRAAPEIDRLVPPGTEPVWPSAPRGQDGLSPFLTVIKLWRLRENQPDQRRRIEDPADAGEAHPRQAGDRRFRTALHQLAGLEARQLSALTGYGIPPNVAGEADPIIRLLEVPGSQTQNWTGWYYVRDAAPGLFSRLVRLSAAQGSKQVLQLFDRFAAAWTSPDRMRYWSTELQQGVLDAILECGDSGATQRVRGHLDRLDEEISARAWGPHDRAETWLAQAELWRRVGNQPKAETALRNAIASSLGPGIHHDDRQLTEWLEWLDIAANAGTVDCDELVSTCLTYVGRLLAADDADSDAAEAAGRLIGLVWTADPEVSTNVAETLCEAGVIDEVDAIEAVLVAAARQLDISIPLVAEAATELLVPLLKNPSRTLGGEIGLRPGPETSDALAMLAQAERTWSLQEQQEDEPPSTPSPPESEHPTQKQTPSTAQALLAAMRATSDGGDSQSGAANAIDIVVREQVTPPVARALLEEASRLRLTGEALGGIVALAARAGQAERAAAVLAEDLARTPAYGWIRHHDGGSRLKILRAALRYRDPVLVRLAANDLAGVLATGGIAGQILPADLRRITEVIGGPEAVGDAWTHIAEYLDVFAPGSPDGLSAVARTPVGGSATTALLRWVSGFFGHPVRQLDFGARRVLQAALEHGPADAQSVLSEAIRAGGWTAEAALHTLVAAPQPPPQVAPDLAEAIDGALQCDDAICRDLARRLARRYGLPTDSPAPRPLPDAYRLEFPPLPERSAPEVDAEGVPHLDRHDPQHMVAPFDLLLRMLADRAGLDEDTVLYRAASIARGLDMPWIRGGHREQARRLKSRGQRHGYRPWAYMAGRRALGLVLAELLDARMLGAPPPLPSYSLGLVDEALIHVEAVPLDESTPPPWRPSGSSSYDVRDWCRETSDAVDAYAAAISAAPTYVLAEKSEWRALEWGTPEETRQIRAGHGEGSPAGLVLPTRARWERTITPAGTYPNLADVDWSDQPLVVQAWELYSDPPYLNWLALHPAVPTQLGWVQDGDLFAWRGEDGAWRARTVRRVRGQLSHSPPAHTYCAEVWQVILSDIGLAELRQRFGPIDRELEIERELPARPREDRPSPEQSSASTKILEPGAVL
jgi:hypothetical protein